METVTIEKEMMSVRNSLYNYACQLTQCVEDAEDLVQETMYKILKNSSKFVNDQNFKGWTFTILKNIFINDYRKNAKRKQINDTTSNDYFLNLSNVSAFFFYSFYIFYFRKFQYGFWQNVNACSCWNII